MDLIVAAPDWRELGVINRFKTFDCVNSLGYEIKDNDFELKMTRAQWEVFKIQKGYFVYINGTEFGGKVEGVNVSGETVTITGLTWRGALAMPVIPSVEYKFIGEANAAIKGAVDGRNFEHYISAENNTGIAVDSVFEYPNVLQALTEGLQAVGMRLNVKFYNGFITLSAVSVSDYSEKIDLSEDYPNASIKATDDISCYKNHFIAVGKDGLTVQRWMQEDGVLLEARPSGWTDRSVFIKSENETDSAKLLEAIEKKKESCLPKKLIEIILGDAQLNVELGDVVAGRERITGFYTTGRIYKKILRIDNDKNKITLNHEVK